MASVRVRTATGLFLAGLVVAALWAADAAAPGLIPWIGGSLLALLAAFELGRMGSLAGRCRALLLPGLVLLSALAILQVNQRQPGPWLAALWLFGIQFATLLVGTLMAPFAPLDGERSASDDLAPDSARRSFLVDSPLGLGFLAAWVGPPMAALAFIHAGFGTAALAVLLVLSKLGDVAGYFVGRSLGKRHPFPKLSPGKTVAGCVASVLSGVAAGAGAGALGYLPGHGGPLAGAVVGGVLNIAAQAADLFESYVKRTAGVKDSSGMAGASGGILDVIDSVLFTIPAGLVVFAALTS